MKTLTTVGLLLLSMGASASEWWSEAGQSHTFYRDSNLRTSSGFKLSLGKGAWYGFASVETPELTIEGEPMGRMYLPGVGLGFRGDMSESWSAFMEVGYYIPTRDTTANSHQGVSAKMNKVLERGSPLSWEHAEYATHDGVGLTVGAAYSVDLSESATLKLAGAYRMLTIKENYNTWNDNGSHRYRHQTNRNLDSVQFGVSFQWSFD